jgi:hypothetical protein
MRIAATQGFTLNDKSTVIDLLPWLPDYHTLDSRYGGDKSNYIIALDPRLLEEVGDLGCYNINYFSQ